METKVFPRFLIASSANSVVSSVATTSYIGVTNTVEVEIRDSNDVAMATSNEKLYLKIDSPATSTEMLGSAGIYTATFTPLAIGTINVSVWIENIPVNGLLANYFPSNNFSGLPIS
jgi:hypothetical protein